MSDEKKKDNIEQALIANFDLPELLEFAYNEGGFSVIPTKEGVDRGHALAATKGQTQIQLDMLLDQMRLVAKQASDIKKKVELSAKIYRATMNFEPDIGSTYHLYLKQDGTCALSLISPEEWGDENRYGQWLAKILLGADHTWSVLESSEHFKLWKES